ncbi:MAG: hypothetical protein JXJ17_11225, partial [Anaerolineae bacterium]|nr:hypothetical protein [Anaerolineae bacterium]
MQHRVFRSILFVILLLMAVGIMVGCKGTPAVEEPAEEEAAEETVEEAAEEPAEEPAEATGVKVGLSFSDFATERWKNEEVLMRGLLEDM